MPEEASLQPVLAIAADWLWTVDGDLATIATRPTGPGGAERTQRHPSVFDLTDDFGAVADDDRREEDLAAILRRVAPLRRRIFKRLGDAGDRHLQLNGLPLHDRDRILRRSRRRHRRYR